MQDKRLFLGVPPGPGFTIADDNPLTHGLVGLFVNNGGRQFDYVNSAKATTHTAVHKPTARGAALAYSNTQTRFQHVAAQELLGDLTIAVWFDLTARTNYGALISKGTGATTNQPFELRLGAGATDGRVELLRASAGGYRSFNASATSIVSTGANQSIIAVGGPLIQDTPTFYVNGIEYLGITTGAVGTGAATGTSGEIYIGKRADGVTQLNGNILGIGLWNRQLRKQEALQLRWKPYQLLTARRVWVPVKAASSNVTITGTPGNAVAAGVAARVNQARAVTGTTGNAAAAGITAKVNQARTVTGSVGNAVAAGVTATVNRATSIAATPGNAVAAGVNATITAAGAVVITGTPGNAAAAGVSAPINQARSVTGAAGNAAAAGVQATISTSSAGVTITASPGNAFASGPQAIIVRNVAIAAAVGNAVAAGRQATVSNITATDDLYPLEGMSQDYPLQGMTQTYPLAGQTPS